MTAAGTVNDLDAGHGPARRRRSRSSPPGKRINQPSDDPYGASLAIQLSGELAGLDAVPAQRRRRHRLVQAGDTALGDINNIVQRVRELVVQNGNDSYSPSDRTRRPIEIDQLIDAIKQTANAQYAGQYIFSGTATTTQPYQPAATDTYAGNSGTINREIAPQHDRADQHRHLAAARQRPGRDDGKLLDMLRNISQDLRGGTTANTNALRTTDLQQLDGNLSTLTQIAGERGRDREPPQLASSRIQDLQLSQHISCCPPRRTPTWPRPRSTTRPSRPSYNAALRASANIVQSSLLDFLKLVTTRRPRVAHHRQLALRRGSRSTRTPSSSSPTA